MQLKNNAHVEYLAIKLKLKNKKKLKKFNKK